MEQARPEVGQLERRLGLSPQLGRGDKALQIERLLPRQHRIDSARQFVREHGEGFGLAVFVFGFGKRRFAELMLP